MTSWGLFVSSNCFIKLLYQFILSHHSSQVVCLCLQGVTKQVLGLIKSVAGNDDVKVAIASKGGLELMLDVMAKHIKQAGIVETGCAAVSTVCLRQPEHCKRLMAAEGYDVIIKGMQIHPNEVMLQVGINHP